MKDLHLKFVECIKEQQKADDSAGFHDMIIQFFVQKLQNLDINVMWFQVDGAIYRTTRVTIQLLQESFTGRVISRFVDKFRLPSSCDLMSLDIFFGVF